LRPRRQPAPLGHAVRLKIALQNNTLLSPYRKRLAGELMLRPKIRASQGQLHASVDRGDLERFCRDVLIAAGSGRMQAAAVAAHLVGADVAGRWSHGVHLLDYYLREIEVGAVDPQASPSEELISEWAVRIRGRRSFGQCAATAAVEAAIRLNGEGKPAFVAVVEAGHIGRLEPFVRRLADAGSLALMTSAFAGNKRESAVSAYPGGRRVLGTNPIAVAGPGPFAIDVSTAQTSVYQVLLQRLLGSELPQDAIVDSSGAPSVSPQAYMDGGSILPAGGHKGLALSIASVLIGALGGADGFGGTVLFALPVPALTNLDVYRARAEQVASILHAEANASGGRVRVPGVRPGDGAAGIRLPAPVLSALLMLATRYDVLPARVIECPRQ
jgi:LDH2 family malate/lactate/ureidoglycolate dehydrogenase